jgi:branched-chain amino acid transport system substrate-binding protein
LTRPSAHDRRGADGRDRPGHDEGAGGAGPRNLSRRLLLALPASLFAAPTFAADPILAGVSGPLTGPNAQYGAQWKHGFDLALDEINGAGDINGRPLGYVFEDSQSDPRQSITIAQKFVSDPRIIMELGDFSSPASMAASPIYQRAKLVQFGFTNSHPDFTKGGDYMWSSSPSQADEQPRLAAFAVQQLGIQRPGVLHLNTDWGRTSKDVFVKAAAGLGANVVGTEGYLPTDEDFRPALVRLRDAKPDALILLSYYADAALIARQVHDLDLKQVLVASTSIYSPKFIELAGPAANGVFCMASFFPSEPRPEVQRFVTAYRAKYGQEPDTFSAISYDTMILFAALVRQYGATRQGIHDGLLHIKDVPSVIYGKMTFDPMTRRVHAASYKDLVVKDGAFTIWDGTRPARPAL